MRLIVGISGASGPIYGIRLLEHLRAAKIETHLIITPPAARIISHETQYTNEQVKSLASHYYEAGNIEASISSGSFKTQGMIVIPCSIRSLSGIANSYNENLLIRAADVTLKEARKLVLVIRETPLHKGHIQLMAKAADMGAILLPPTPGFYFHPKTIDDLINHTVGKVLDLFGISQNLFSPWGEDALS